MEQSPRTDRFEFRSFPPQTTVMVCEVGPRDGFQFEPVPIPTAAKVRAIGDLARAGLKRIQAVSFVHPDRVPQMADAEAVLEALHGDSTVSAGTLLTGLALNPRGVDRAAAAGLDVVDLSIATNERHGLDNAGMDVEAGVRAAEEMIGRAAAAGMKAQLGLQTVWGYSQPGDTPLDRLVEIVSRFADHPLESFSLADSTGLATPHSIRRVLDTVRDAIGAIPLVLHLHDTRGLGLANVVAGLEAGVRRFDTSLGGMGGCPFIPGATGNIATEDTVYLLEGLGAKTGVDRVAVSAVSRRVAALVGHALSGKLYALEGEGRPQ